MSAAAELPGLLTIPELARLAGQHRSTVYRAIDEGRLRAIRPGGKGDLRIPPLAARHYLEGLEPPDADDPATLASVHKIDREGDRRDC